MKPVHFFSPQHNSANQKTEKPKKLPTGYVSATGKLVFPTATFKSWESKRNQRNLKSEHRKEREGLSLYI